MAPDRVIYNWNSSVCLLGISGCDWLMMGPPSVTEHPVTLDNGAVNVLSVTVIGVELLSL